MEVVVVLKSNCCPIERLSGPLAVAVEPMAVAVSKAETLNRPVSGRHRVSRVDSHSSVEGLSGPLAVAGVELSPLLERAGSTGVRLADGVARGQFVSVHIVTVLKSGGEGDSVTNSISDGSISAPLANTVAMRSVDSGAGEEAGGRPGGQAGAAVVIG